MSTKAGYTPKHSAHPDPGVHHDRFVAGAKVVNTTAGGKSRTGGAAKGGAKGALVGAELGSIVPVVGTTAGAVVGGTVGAAGGAHKAHKAKREAARARRAALGPGRQLVTAEFLVCLVILLLSPLTPKHSAEGAAGFLKRGAAICGLFFILAVASTGGPKAAKVAAGLGGLVTLALLVSSREIFGVMASAVGGGGGGTGAADPGTDNSADPSRGTDAGAAVGSED